MYFFFVGVDVEQVICNYFCFIFFSVKIVSQFFLAGFVVYFGKVEGNFVLVIWYISLEGSEGIVVGLVNGFIIGIENFFVIVYLEVFLVYQCSIIYKFEGFWLIGMFGELCFFGEYISIVEVCFKVYMQVNIFDGKIVEVRWDGFCIKFILLG